MKTTQGTDVDLSVCLLRGPGCCNYLLHLVAVSYFTVFPLFLISNLLTVLNFEEATLMMTTCTHHQVSL